ncbi:uncharacterized protein DS421_1g15670 [Arachis hypogaea]|nr:uncharacterized protein DS421_1g15670 [Arachis hypogaea]
MIGGRRGEGCAMEGRKFATFAARWKGSEGAGGGCSKLEVCDGGCSKLEVATATVAGGGWTEVRE